MPAWKVLYLTSVNPAIYAASGKGMVASFVATKTEGSLLVSYEGGGEAADLCKKYPNVLGYDLEQSSFLASWLQANADVIPERLGGKYKKCTCPNPSNPHSKSHRPGCPGAWFNAHASRWFRKIVTLDEALGISSGYDIFVWVDADCRFKKRLTAETVLGFFKGAAVFYLKSVQRLAPESGVLGFHLERGGAEFIENVVARYRSGLFRKSPRWDDGYQFGEEIKAGTCKCVDLATRATGHADVVCNSPLAPYIDHDKGKHSRVLGIFK